jgi:hypothetical protein
MNDDDEVSWKEPPSANHRLWFPQAGQKADLRDFVITERNSEIYPSSRMATVYRLEPQPEAPPLPDVQKSAQFLTQSHANTSDKQTTIKQSSRTVNLQQVPDSTFYMSGLTSFNARPMLV